MDVSKKSFNLNENAFDLIRYIAAFCVMVGHYGWKGAQYSNSAHDFYELVGIIAAFFPGVVVLFSLSGFLIAASYDRSKGLKEFFIKRIFRMYPELWYCTIINFIVVTILAYEKFDKSIIMWLGTQIIGIANTPSCLRNFATGSINGALWTVFVEIQLYVVLALLFNILRKMSEWMWWICIALLGMTNLIMWWLSVSGRENPIFSRTFVPYAIWFFIGTFCYLYRDKVIPILKKYVWVMLFIYILLRLMPLSIPGYYSNIIIRLLLPFIVIGGGYRIHTIHLKCDLTYGIFLYHWIVLNVIIHFNLMNRLPGYICFIMFIGITLFLAWFSWKHVGRCAKNITNILIAKL